MNTNKFYSKKVYNKIWTKNVKGHYAFTEVVIGTTRKPKYIGHTIVQAYRKDIRDNWVKETKQHMEQKLYEDAYILIARINVKGFKQTIFIEKEQV